MTPEKIEQEILDFLHRINSESPFYLDVVPDPRSTVNGCFDNVEAKIRQDGGAKIVGWQIWKTKHLIEAEFHGVWKKPTGEIIDITPKAIKSIDKILFLPDYNQSYQETNVDNIRWNITSNKLVDDLILASELIFLLLNKGNRVKFREVFLNQAENLKHQKLIQIKNGVVFMLSKDDTIHSGCFCGGQLTYKKCHAKELAKLSRA